MPTMNASPALSPRSNMRFFQYCVETCQIGSCWRITRLKRMRTPASRMTAAKWSPRLQPARSARPRGPVTQSAASAIRNAAETVENCGQRISPATTDAPAARA